MQALGFNVKKPEVVKLVHEVDPHNNGTIEYDHFLEISKSTHSVAQGHSPSLSFTL